MAKKQDPLIETSQALQSLFTDPVGNYDAITAALEEQRNLLLTIRDSAQKGLDWLTALGFALQQNKIEAMVRKAKEQ